MKKPYWADRSYRIPDNGLMGKTFGEALIEVDPKDRKYSFVGRPDFGRIIRENAGADVIIISREDGLVNFLFFVGEFKNMDVCEENLVAGLERAVKATGRDRSFMWLKELSNGDVLPGGWRGFNTSNSEHIKDLRKVAQAFVRARTGKHTVEVLP
jgi:hypothetical protein